jgi:4-hydroxy-tetrahydrodipicolinate synthase
MATTLTFRGVYTALITPMREDGSIDWETLDRHVKGQVKAGVQGLVPVGTTGESPTLDNDEHLEVIEAVVAAAGGEVPVIAGTGANSTAEALYLTREADIRGADAFLQVAPYYNKPSQEGLYQHFRRIADSTNKPIVLYSIPGRCGVEIGVETVARLAADCPNVRAIKEAGGDVARVGALRKACPQVTVLSGDDGLVRPFVEAGARGVVSVASNLAPEAVLALAGACLGGRAGEAAALEAQWQALLTELVFLDGNPVTIKEALYHAGRIPAPGLRLPLVRMHPDQRQRVRALLASLNLLPA